MAEFEDGVTPPVPAPVSGRFAALPPRVEREDMVEEHSIEKVPEATPDPNTEIAWRWGIGIAPGG